MSFKKEKGSYCSNNGIDTISYYTYIPKEPPKAVLQISHGLSEHFGRYDEFATNLVNQGFVVCGNDHLGHGRTSQASEDLGYFGEKHGWAHMVDDMYTLTHIIKGEYGNLPYFLLGYSLGSMLSRAYLTCYGKELSGAILVGVNGRNKKVITYRPFVKLLRRLHGDRHRSKLIYIIAFANYNKKYGSDCDRLMWMLRDPKALKEYRTDPLCNFMVTVAAFEDMMQLMYFVDRKEWASEVPKDLPLYLISGDMDPVGEYGKGVQQVYKELLNAGVKELSMKLYTDGHHDILKDLDKEIVYEDIVSWIRKHM
jgi:alpha-beta hydrolase superfamily lysophospholipase